MLDDRQLHAFVTSFMACLRMYTDATAVRAYLEGASTGDKELDKIPVSNRYIQIRCKDAEEEDTYERLYSRVLTDDQCAHVIFIETWK